MNKQNHLYKTVFLIVSLFFLTINETIAQGLNSEQELKTKAATFFAEDRFAEAFPLYSQLLSLDPKNPELNYRFGVCLMYTDRTQTEAPLQYLEKAINKVTDIDFYYYLGQAYQNNYFFTDAIYNYRKYLQLARNKARKDFEVERKISMCENGMEMLKAANDLYVMQKSEVDRNNFYRSYDLHNFGGRFLNLPEEYLSKADLKNKKEEVTFFNPQARILLYAISNKGQKDIYYRTKLSDGSWSDAKLLSSTINSPYDEDYPFLMPDGKTLFFSSKGHNTMGGYDIFQSVYDSLSHHWSKPTNLSFPFNTPSDDIQFISDANETIAWFASNRNSVNDKITVYKVGIIKKDPAATNLSDVYQKEKLANSDLGRIKNMAQLDINISDKDFNEIPVSQKEKLDALVKNDAQRISQNIRQANLKNIDNQIQVKEIQAGLNDSIKQVVQQISTKIEGLKSLYLQSENFVTTKNQAIGRGNDDLSSLLSKAQKTSVLQSRKNLLAEANKTLFTILRENHQLEKLKQINSNLKGQISNTQLLLDKANAIYGDIQKNIVTRNETDAYKNIDLLNELIQKADTLTDYQKQVDFSTGKLYFPNYPSNLLNANQFVAFSLRDETEYLSPIISRETRYEAYLPITGNNPDLDLLKKAENTAQQLRSQNKQLAYQLKLTESVISEKRNLAERLFKEAQTQQLETEKHPTTENVAQLNLRFAEARRAAYQVWTLEKTHDSLQTAFDESENLTKKTTDLRSQIELLVEKGQLGKAQQKQEQLQTLEKQSRALPVFATSNQKKTETDIFPKALENKESYVEFTLENGQLKHRDGDAFATKNIDELIANSQTLNNETAQPKTPSTTQTAGSQAAHLTIQSMRTKLNNITLKQDNRLNQLQQQSEKLTQLASNKLDESNQALLEFENMREDYNNGKITDQKAVLAKQTESQNLLYQSLALKEFAEKTDSLYQASLATKKETTNQIFAIEQALQNNEPDKARALLRVLEKPEQQANGTTDYSVEKWIETSAAANPAKKQRANQAFEDAQKLTDESIKLLMEAKELRKQADTKSNAFKRREITVEAESKEKLAVSLQNTADKQLALGTNLFEEIKKTEAVAFLAPELTPANLIAVNTQAVVKPEKEKAQLEKRLATRDLPSALPGSNTSQNLQSVSLPKLDREKLPELNDLVAYQTKRYKAQLLAEELDINKRETVQLLQKEKQASGTEAVEIKQQIANLRQQADSLQKASTQAFLEANTLFKKLPAEDKEKAEKSPNNFESYLKNVRNRIAQLLDDVTLLSEQIGETENEEEQEALRQQADEKEQIAMYLILEEFEIIAQRNKQTYRKNALLLDKLFAEKLSENEQALMLAIFEKINAFMQEANSKRVKAQDDALSFTLQKVLLQDAFALETKALDLQEEAMRMMQQNDTETMLAYQDTKQKQPATVEAKKQEQQPKVAPKEVAVKQPNKPETTPETAKPKEEVVAQKPEPQKESSISQKTEKTSALTQKQEEKAQTTSPKEIAKQKEETKPALVTNKTQKESNEIAQSKEPETEPANEIKEPKESKAVVANNLSKTEAKKEAKSAEVFPLVRTERIPTETRFSVQIAATSQLKTNKSFLNVLDLYAIPDKEKNIYRYYSGKFISLKAAIIRRNALRQQGYTDAFIKSWKAGKAVSILEAAGKIDTNTMQLLNKASNTLPSKFININFSATNISQLNGVYYSVQVGVYSRPRSSAQLFGIHPLYHDRMNNGYWVYFNGIFKSIADAEANKNNVRQKGVSDAFVVAFNEGEKVSLSNARKAISKGEKQPNDQDIVILEDMANAVDSDLQTVLGGQSAPNQNTVYKVQIGVFSKPTNMNWIKTQLNLSKRYPLEHTKNSNGKHVYTLGSFNTYAEASKFNTEQVRKVIKDAFIVRSNK